MKVFCYQIETDYWSESCAGIETNLASILQLICPVFDTHLLPSILLDSPTILRRERTLVLVSSGDRTFCPANEASQRPAKICLLALGLSESYCHLKWELTNLPGDFDPLGYVSFGINLRDIGGTMS